MQNKRFMVVLLTLMLMMVWGGGGLARAMNQPGWSKIQKVGQIQGDPDPLEILQLEDSIVGVYSDQVQQEVHIFQMKWQGGRAKFSELVKYPFPARFVLDVQLFSLTDGYGLVWREKDQDDQSALRITVFDRQGEFIYDQVIREPEVPITALDIYGQGSAMQLIWIEEHQVAGESQSQLYKQRWQVDRKEAQGDEVTLIRQHEQMVQPRLVPTKGEELVILLKENIRSSYYYGVLNLQGEFLAKMGLSVSKVYYTYRDYREYVNLDSGIRAVYDQQEQRLIGTWVIQDRRAAVGRSPALSPTVGILKEGQEEAEQRCMYNFPSMSHFPDLAIGPDGKVGLVWSESIQGTYQVFYTRLEDVLAPENTEAVDQVEDVPVQLLSPPGYGSWYPKLLIDDQGREHLFWWETVKGGHKLLYRNDQHSVRLGIFEKFGLNPELDTFSLRQGIFQVILMGVLTILIGGFFTLINLTSFVLVVGFFSLLAKWGWRESFRNHPGLILAGLICGLWVVQSPANPIYYQIHDLGGGYFYGGALATLLVVLYQRMRQTKTWEVLGMLEMLLVWSFWQHIFLVIPQVFQWVQ